MLDILHRIIQEVNTAQDLAQALSIIVARVRQAITTDVCSVYLVDQNQRELVLMANEGFTISPGTVRLRFNQGIVGQVRERAEPINVDNAPDHPAFFPIPGAGETCYHGFLGVPIIQHRHVLGVLVARQRQHRRFDENEVAFMVTLAAQLAGAIIHAEASGDVKGVHSPAHTGTQYLTGRPGAPGVVFGEAVVLGIATDLNSIPDRVPEDPEAEEKAFREAALAVQSELILLKSHMSALPEEDTALFDAYILMLGSDSLVEQAVANIRAGNWAEGALRETIREHTQVFEQMEDDYLRQRASDIRDLGRRILIRLRSDQHQVQTYAERTILVGDDLGATQLAEVPAAKLCGVVSSHGSGSSHVAILARALNIPAIMGVSELPIHQLRGKELIVDGYRGRLYIAPSQAVQTEYRRLAKDEVTLTENLKELRELPSETPDGVQVKLYINSGLLADLQPTSQSGADGIGLYRTEFPFLVRDRFPGEQAQTDIYRQVLESFHPRPVTLRTLDIGGDKVLPYFQHQEDNPFLGWRGIRVTLDHPEIFLTQLRAILRAAEGLSNLRLLFPMITNVEEVDQALRLLRQAQQELAQEKCQVPLPPVGAMIEVPSAVYQIGNLASRVDFFSVGTNDLTQYLLAVDRNNPLVGDLYDALHPAVLQVLMQIVESTTQYNRALSVCGEMAGDPAATILLLGMGINDLSMSVGSLPRVKWVIRNFSTDRARELLGQALSMENARMIRILLNSALEEKGLGRLVRAAS